MPPTLDDLLWIFLKVVGVFVAIDLTLAYLIWRARGIMRAQDRRRRQRIDKARVEQRFRHAPVKYQPAVVPMIDEVRTAVLPRIQEPPTREGVRHRAIR